MDVSITKTSAGVVSCIRRLSSLAILLLVGFQSMQAGGPSKDVPGNTAAASGEVLHAHGIVPPIVIDGKKASASGILVKLKHAQHRRAMATMLDEQALKVGRSYKHVPGLQRIVSKSGPDRRSFSGVELAARIQALRATGLYEYVEPDWEVHVLQTPTDSAFVGGQLWGLQNTGQDGGTSGVDVNAVPAWGVTAGASTVVVGVIDTGVRYSHQDLAGNMWTNPGEIPGNGVDDDGNGYVDDVYGINAITGSGDPMDDNDHGTHVAGTIAATANDAGQHVGVAYGVEVMALKFISASGTGDTSDAITCIEYAIAQGVDILNNSWGGGGYSQALRDAIQAANDAGILFVAAAGNSSVDNDAVPHYPSSHDVDNVVAVAAIDRNGLLASFSNYGASSVDIGAPGVAILSCTATSDSSYASFNGTSMASPHVAGVAALLKSQYPAASVVELKNRLLITSRPLLSLAGRVETGGMVDAYGALTVAEDGDLELRVAAAGPLLEGVANDFYVTVTDVVPVLGATVMGDLDGGSAVALLDDGAGADLVGGDGVYSATLMVPMEVSTTDLNLQISASGKNPASESFTFSVLMPPANDDFANRIVLAPGTAQTSGSNQLATSEPGEPINPAEGGGKTVWWEWTAAETGDATITTLGSSYDSTLAVYSGNSLGSLSLLGANDDESFFTLQSSVTFSAVSGVTYLIQVDGYAGEAGEIQLNYPLAGGGDGPPVILTQPMGRTVVVGEPFALSVAVTGLAPFTYQWNLEGEPIAGATGSNYVVVVAEEADEGSYTVQVTNDEGTVLSDSAFVAVDLVGLSPANDMFDDALILSGASGQLEGTNLRASGESGEPNHADYSLPHASVWYRWTAAEDGTLEVTTFGSDFDTTLAVYTGASVNALAEVASNDDYFIEQSYVVLEVTGGTTYQIAVDGYDVAVGQILLTFAFSLPPPPVPAPANDAFTDQIDLGGGSTSTTGTNLGATGEAGEPDHAAISTPLGSVWWSWTPPTPGEVTLSTVGSDFDTTLAVYTGDSVDLLTEVASNDDIEYLFNLQSEVTFQVNAGVTYRIAVAGAYGAEGNIALDVAFVAVVAPEIVVEQSGVSLVDGVGSIDFGPVAIGASGERVLTVRNVGTVNLDAISLSFIGSHAADFAATSIASSLSPGASEDFTVTMTPFVSGLRSASLQIASSDSDENPFDVALTGEADTASNLYLSVAGAAGLSGGDEVPEAVPFDDGIENLLKYAFNMNLSGPDAAVLLPGGGLGLPYFQLTTGSPLSTWQFEYLRRKGSGLIYTPMRTNRLDTAFSPMVGSETVTGIDDVWERVVIEEQIDLETSRNGFGYIEVTLP